MPKPVRITFRRVLKALCVILPIVMIVSFFKWRADDMYAWPAPVAEPVVADAPSARALSADELNALFAELPSPTNSPPTECGRAAYAAKALEMLMNGAGLPGRSAALHAVGYFSREDLMDAADRADVPTDPAAAIAAWRAAESLFSPLEKSLDEDLAGISIAVDDLYDDAVKPAAASTNETRKIGPFTAWMVRNLGGTRELTHRHLEALFSNLRANSRAAYSPEGLTKGLPEWCVSNTRPPWTRDPLGALLASGYMRHACMAAALDPSIRLELRAARIAIALRVYREARGEYPEDISALFGTTPLERDDAIDPFSVDAAPLRYARDGDGWRIWSVGLDQVDGGGISDAYTERDRSRQKNADFVLTSRERELRK